MPKLSVPCGYLKYTSMINYELPKEVRKYVLQLQAALKIKTGNGKFSQQQTINWIIKEHKEKGNTNG